MNITPYLMSFGLLAGLAYPLAAVANRDRVGGGQVEVQFEEPNQFTDIQRSYNTMEADESYLKDLREYIEQAASSRLQAGQRLQVTITNVDMAGDFEPERGPELHDVRIVRSIYPPRIDLRYTLTDSAGSVISQGERQLRDLAFEYKLPPATWRDDPLRHEKMLLQDFFSEITRAPATRAPATRAPARK